MPRLTAVMVLSGAGGPDERFRVVVGLGDDAVDDGLDARKSVENRRNSAAGDPRHRAKIRTLAPGCGLSCYDKGHVRESTWNVALQNAVSEQFTRCDIPTRWDMARCCNIIKIVCSMIIACIDATFGFSFCNRDYC